MAGQLLLMSGFPLYPSIIICCLVSEIKEIVENGLEVSQIPELAKKAFSELRQINNVYELPRVVMFSPDLYGIVDRVATMSCVLFGIRFIFHFSSPIWSPLYKKVYAYFSQKDDLLTLDSLKIFIQSIRRSILKWQRVLQQTDPAEAHIDAMKREISLTCREMINKLRTLDQISPQEQREGRSAIDQLLGVLKGNVLKPLGARGDRQEETSNNGLNGDDDFLPFMKLSEAGFRVSDWNEVLAGLGWDQNLNGYLDLKLIEKGIFSRKDAENILAEISPEKRLQALKGLLLDVSAASPPTLWSRVKEVAKKVNRVADYLFAIGFHSLSSGPSDEKVLTVA